MSNNNQYIATARRAGVLIFTDSCMSAAQGVFLLDAVIRAECLQLADKNSRIFWQQYSAARLALLDYHAVTVKDVAFDIRPAKDSDIWAK